MRVSAFTIVVNPPCGRPVVTLPPSPTPPHGQDGVSVHSGSRERERRCGDSGGGLRHLGRGSQPPLVLKPETTRSGLIYRERRGGHGVRREGTMRGHTKMQEMQEVQNGPPRKIKSGTCGSCIGSGRSWEPWNKNPHPKCSHWTRAVGNHSS